MALPGKDAKIECCATKGGTYYEVDGIKTMNLDEIREMADITNFNQANAGSGDYDETRNHNAQLFQASGSISGDYLPSDTNGQVVIQTAVRAGTSVWFKFYWNGTNYDLVECLVTSSKSHDVGGNAQVTFNLTGISIVATT